MFAAKQAIVEEQFRDMVASGIVEPSHSGWASPVVLPPKKDGGHRFCADFRKVNSVTKTDTYPLSKKKTPLSRWTVPFQCHAFWS